MIYAIFLALPLATGALTLPGGLSTELVLAVAVAWLLVVVSLLVRRFVLVVVSAVILILAFLAQAFSPAPPPLFWPAIGFGLGIFAMLEIGHDCTTLSHGRLTVRAYALRARYLAIVAGVDLFVVFVVATLAYNLAVRYPGLPFEAALLPALVVVIAGVGVMIVLRLRRSERQADPR
ncbi:MAG: hypothetical protein ACOCVW_01665 [bacterium]